MKRVAIIGHRGVGKTSLLQRYEEAYRSAGLKLRPFDLDREIEHNTSVSIHEIFQNEGEAVFRRYEREAFSKIETELTHVADDAVVVCGAGFDPADISPTWHVIWVRRPTDQLGRIFTNRPRLNAKTSPLEEYLERLEPREQRYGARADEIFWMDEGVEEVQDPAERAFILDQFESLGGAITLLPEQFEPRRVAGLKNWIETRVRWGVSWFELRDDLLTADQMKAALNYIPPELALLSFRDPAREEQSAGWIDRLGLHYDWPVERGECPYGAPRFFSLHTRTGTLEEAFKLFPHDVAPGTQLKAALPIRTIAELEIAHRWQMASSRQRLFLPMSNGGRWAWYRLLRAPDYSLNFIREGAGSAVDQPTLLQWARRRQIAGSTFAAILGDPVQHSRTPMEHARFFAEKNASVYAIQLPLSEATNEAMGFLRELGLRWAAVTSPLKTFAFKLCSGLSERADEMKAVNTLIFDTRHGVWAGTNTDLDGFSEAVKTVEHELGAPIAIWGGGGTLEVVRHVLPKADSFSMRTGEFREGAAPVGYAPHAVVWAVGRSNDLKYPPSNWKPKWVLDLNYSENSPGREYALSVGAKYISGLTMFHAQAAIQRSFWAEGLK